MEELGWIVLKKRAVLFDTFSLGNRVLGQVKRWADVCLWFYNAHRKQPSSAQKRSPSACEELTIGAASIVVDRDHRGSVHLCTFASVYPCILRVTADLGILAL